MHRAVKQRTLLRRFGRSREFIRDQGSVPVVKDPDSVPKSLTVHLAIVTARMLGCRVFHVAVASHPAVPRCVSMHMDIVERFRLELLSASTGDARSKAAVALPHTADT